MDRKVILWEREYYEVEAETIEEAAQMIKDCDVDSYDSETLFDCEELMSVADNNGAATIEIYDNDSNDLVWDNSVKE